MSDRVTLLAASVTHVGAVRKSNEDSHWVDADAGIAIVCDGMGGHAAGEVASDLAVTLVRDRWTAPAIDRARATWIRTGTPEARRALIVALRDAVADANRRIIEESTADRAKHGMGTTFTGVVFVGGEALFAHAGDSRGYLVREGIAVRVTEDHTLLARLAEAGVDVTSGEPQRWKGVVTNALGIGEPTKVATFSVPLADGDRFLLCSDGVSEYFEEDEIGQLLTSLASPSKAAQRLVDLAIERGGHDNATAIVIKVVEAGPTARSPEVRKKDDEALARCPLLAGLTPQKRLRVLRIASEHAIHDGEALPARFLGDRVAWIVLAGAVQQDGDAQGRGAFLYPESLVSQDLAEPSPEWSARGEVRALVLRASDVSEMAAEEPDLGEKLYETLGRMVEHTIESPVTGESEPYEPTES